jgi:hypothetical protein
MVQAPYAGVNMDATNTSALSVRFACYIECFSSFFCRLFPPFLFSFMYTTFPPSETAMPIDLPALPSVARQVQNRSAKLPTHAEFMNATRLQNLKHQYVELNFPSRS